MSPSSSSNKSEVEICSGVSVSETVNQLHIRDAIINKIKSLLESGHFQDDGSLGSVSQGKFHDSSSSTGTSLAGKQDYTAGQSFLQDVNQESEECLTVEMDTVSVEGEIFNRKRLTAASTVDQNPQGKTTSHGKSAGKSVKSHIVNLQGNQSKHRNCKSGTDTPVAKHSQIARPKIISEYQRCVLLLEKYGIVSRPDLCKSQKFIPRVPHPGYAGDGVRSKRCKVCGALEDANSTVICDECQEVFHLSCCLPRVGYKYFDKEDNWYCSYCTKQKRRTDNIRYFQLVDTFGSACSSRPRHNSKVRLGPAYQADVLPWTGKECSQGSCCVGCPGVGVSALADENDADKELLETYKRNLLSNNWLPAKMLSPATPENWLRCKSVFVKAFIDRNGRKHSEVICGKWRRAPCHVRQSDNWECFCVIEWDPSHADCSVPQELPTEEIMQRIQCRSTVTNGSSNQSTNSE